MSKLTFFKKRFFYLSFVLLAFNSCKTNPNNKLPNELKTGKFKYLEGSDGVIIEKSLTSQVEYHPKNNIRISFGIRWKNSSEYDLTFLGGTKGCLKVGEVINVKVISHTREGYKYEAYNEHCGGKMSGELVKIN